jgi:hypothetical protein
MHCKSKLHFLSKCSPVPSALCPASLDNFAALANFNCVP